MIDYVKLRPSDAELVITVMQMVVDYKFQSLQKENWKVFECKYLPKFIEQMQSNQFKVADVHSNTFTWLIDNVIHSKRVVDGIPKRDWIPLTDLDIVQECMTVLRAASRGSTSYATHCKTTSSKFSDLFQ